MNTLELMVEEVLKKNGFVAQPEEVVAAAECIERYNECKDPSDDIYTPEMWLHETMERYPETLPKKKDGYFKIADYLSRQRKMCVEHTGRLPDDRDFAETFECEEFSDKFGTYDIDFSDFINFLLLYYECEGKLGG